MRPPRPPPHPQRRGIGACSTPRGEDAPVRGTLGVARETPPSRSDSSRLTYGYSPLVPPTSALATAPGCSLTAGAILLDVRHLDVQQDNSTLLSYVKGKLGS